MNKLSYLLIAIILIIFGLGYFAYDSENNIIDLNKLTSKLSVATLPNEITGEFICSKIPDTKNTKKKNLQKSITDYAANMLGQDCVYQKFIFKGKSTVVIETMGMEFASTYFIDDSLIRIKTDKSDLILTIKNENTLIGEGFAEGLYRKSADK